MSGRRYLIVSPGRNEAKYMRRTLESVAAQSVPPALWVVVDDGSTDESPAILAEYRAKLPYLRVVTRPDRGKRAVGPGVMEAFYAGLGTTHLEEFGYLCKLDLDLVLPPRYFESLMQRMESDPRLGTCSGKAYYRADDPINAQFSDRLVSEAIGDEMSIGASKFYRVECFRQIGGFLREVMWDGVDCHRCRLFGWGAGSFDDADLRFLHLRPMGSSQQSMWKGRLRWGAGQYFMGTGLPFMTVSALYRMTRRPFVVGGVGIWWGFVRSMLSGASRYDDPAFRRFLRRYQWEAMVLGKGRAAERALARSRVAIGAA
ncbi:MAG: glycosyltransferase family 2 protein [Phycisphaerales bacterium]|nr:glycosyltransferase family 2 protein [Phycisphaerales bacterium]